MLISLEAQTLVFLEAILLGIILSVFYEILRAIRHTAKAGIVMTACLDGLFWCIVLISYFLFVIAVVQGEGRGYILLGSALGAILYFMTISPVILKILTAIFKLISNILSFINSLRRKAAEKVKRKFRKNKKCDKIRKKHFQFWSKRYKIK